jgi:hypothetical protein
MRAQLSVGLAIGLGVAAVAWSKDEKTVGLTKEQVIENFRRDLQATEADAMAKGLTLDADQAAKFWPLFEEFQKEQSVIADAQLASSRKYVETYATASDADALEYIHTILEGDDDMTKLRKKYLVKFQAVLPGRIAARAIQIDRRIEQITQVEVSSKLPLVH